MIYHSLPFMSESEKGVERDLILRGGPRSPDERALILDYCERDVDATALLFDRMRPAIDLERALVRGWYTKSVARIERTGIPLDVPMFDHLRAHLDQLSQDFTSGLDPSLDVYEGSHFREFRFLDWLDRRGYRWPRTATGKPALDDGAFDRMAVRYPDVRPLRDLRKALGEFRSVRALPIGADGRNRASLWPFSSSTGRNLPSGREFIFNLASWVRGLIRPEQGRALVYLDYRSQEFAIAAYLSGDPRMIAAYESGRDPYLELGRHIGFVPTDATKKSHPEERKILKVIVLGTQYGQGEVGLARRVGWPVPRARRLLGEMWATYPRLKQWLDGAVDYAMLHGRLHTCFGWEVLTHRDTKATTLMNFPIQARAAEMLRWACSLATDRELMANCPVHDALLVEGPLDDVEGLVAATQRAMGDASSIVLDGPRLETDPKVIRWPDRFRDDAGWNTWSRITEMVGPVRSGEVDRSVG
jgi:DNA polymerase family A